MRKWVQLDGQTVTGILEAASAPEQLPNGRTFVAVPNGEDIALASVYDPNAKTFTAPVEPVRTPEVTNADLLAEIKKLTKP